MIRLLTSNDATEYHQLRLLSRQSNPQSFISTFDHDHNLGFHYFKRHLELCTTPPVYGVYGFFLKHQLVGHIQLSPEYLPKQHHLANIYELYIHPNHRHQGMASSLITNLIQQAQDKTSLEQIHLKVNSSNLAAIKLYQSLGFTHTGTRKQAIKESHNRYQDEISFVIFLT